jgi:hypothetical protein
MKLRKLALASLLTATAGIPAVTMADSDLAIGAGNSATADLNFSVVIPQFIYFQVGAVATPGTLDTVLFDLGVAGVEPGTGTDVADTNSPVPVVLRSNAASITISAQALAGTGPLAAGSTEISATPSNPSIPVPGFGLSAASVAGPINASGNWVFTYDNAGVYPAGIYNTTVTYTAASP